VPDLLDRDWFMIEGTVEPLGFDGPADDIFPLELAERVIASFTRPGDWVLDPFAGLGTTLVAAQRLGRRAVGFELNPARAAFATGRIHPPSRIVNAAAQELGRHPLPPLGLVFTSPPYITVRMEDEPWGPTYFDDMTAIFREAARHVRPDGHIVVEVSNVLTGDGFRPFAGQFADALGRVLVLEREIVRINSLATPAGPGVGHSSLYVFRPPG
jgi:SAM-dependent methyltransferase